METLTKGVGVQDSKNLEEGKKRKAKEKDKRGRSFGGVDKKSEGYHRRKTKGACMGVGRRT